ncbi:hypothetical protein [Rhizosphaericola mali]|uniref:Uncharacterized protein n=1 Tax=Rhizosphaericola mali TaxID=2545455 RepID=A0A5P2G0K9_9BACT|nr:hypothetical protein [Rhizosphaericola mali]QES87659.1 hypothetical protein E0W69_002915 [Rhizosphaericola mali]
MAKLVLSEKEWSIVQNFDFLLTKNQIIDHIQQFFTQLGCTYRDIAKNTIPKENEKLLQTSPKVSKGEKYEGLPYLMLDFPRIFQNGNTFAIRSFFLWGKAFSISLLLEGEYKNHLQTKIFENQVLRNWQYETEDSPWIHFQSDSSKNHFSTISKSQINQHPFLKLTNSKPLQDWQTIETFFLESFQQIMEASFC